MVRQTVTTYDDVMTFGKHMGKTIYWIADNEPSYIVWLSEEEIVKFPKDMLEAAMIDDMNNFPLEEFYWKSD